MAAFLKIDTCARCGRALPWEWVPAVCLAGKPLAGTGVWRSTLVDHHCATCVQLIEKERQAKAAAERYRNTLVALLGGEKPYQAFTFERFQVMPGNRRAFGATAAFDPSADNLYLWGGSGIGKTHLACAAARRAAEEGLSVQILRLPELVRKTRMKEPEVEQSIVDRLINVDVLVFEDLGSGPTSAYGRQILREILDGRDYQNRAGLLATSAYALNALVMRLGDDAIVSRLAGLCRIIELAGPDGRLRAHSSVRILTDPVGHKSPPTNEWA